MKRLPTLLIVITFVLLPVTVQAQSGTISADPNPCEIFLMQNLCTSRITWSSQDTSLVEIWVQRGDNLEKLYVRAPGGRSDFRDPGWIQELDYVFSLYDYSSGARGALLASVTVTGKRSLRCEPLR